VSLREEAAAAACELGRQTATYAVKGRPLTRNGRTLQPGTRLRLSHADAEILLERGRIVRAGGKASAPAGPASAE
jgi:hypothetical protein